MNKNHRHIRLTGAAHRLASLLLLICLACGSAQAQGIVFSGQKANALPVQFSHSVYRLDSDPQARLIALEFTPVHGHYAYANDPGEAAGRPTSVKPIFKTAPDLPPPDYKLIYPLGKQIADIYSGGKQVNVYDGPTSIFIAVYPAKENGLSDAVPSREDPAASADSTNGIFTNGRLDVELEVQMLICSLTNCTPVKKLIPVKLAADASLASAEAQPWWPEYAEALKIIQNTMPALSPVYDSPGLEIESLGKAVFFGLIAGLILNFMPCVFPVVSLKLLSFIIALGQPDAEKRIRAFRHQNLMFSLGVLVWFSLLSALLSAMDLLWGQIFQSQIMVLVILLLVFALTLSLFGLFMLPSFAFREKQGQMSKRSAFITGMLSTCLATPCSGPLLGGVLGWSFNQSQPTLGIVFLAVGLGMASPYLFLALFPKMGRYFPKPGPWLARLEVSLGFFLLLTCVYLFSLLTSEMKMGAGLGLALLFCLGLLWGRRQNAHGMNIIFYWRSLLACVLVLAAFMVIWNHVLFRERENRWVPYSEELFMRESSQKNIVIDFTADWCPNCKLLERTVFTEERMEEWENKYNVLFMQVDLTHDNPAGYALLSALNSSSIPVVALFPRQADIDAPLSPIVLRDLFGPARLEEAAEKAWSNPDG
ncbi:MAG: thioredoxin family protein [Desulfovibrionaceae bacterium]|nr:thioredoxin family protein [Desulfovibrionaceae bacterium]